MTTPQGDPAAPASTALPEQEADDLRARVDGLASTIQRIPEMIRDALGQAHQGAEKHEEAKLDRPTREADRAADMGELVRQAVADHDKTKAAAEKRNKAQQATEERLAKVEKATERPPAPHEARRRHKFMRWGS